MGLFSPAVLSNTALGKYPVTEGDCVTLGDCVWLGVTVDVCDDVCVNDNVCEGDRVEDAVSEAVCERVLESLGL